MSRLALYIHIPFCVRKCFYCDFVAGPVGEGRRRRYLTALEEEIRRSPYQGWQATTVFFGGGTPSELRLDEIRRLVVALRESFDLAPVEEWTVECNPGTLADGSLDEYRRLGFNRVSLGVQSFHNRHLKALGRIHDADQARQAVAAVRRAGFDNLSLDLIFGLPGQTLEEWAADLDEALALRPEHLSLYSLTIEDGTEFGRRRRLGLLAQIDDDLAADMFERAMDRTSDYGYEHYEISSFARPGFRARHNQIYWHHRPYLGFGVGAASYVDGVRWTNCRGLGEYSSGIAGGSVPRFQEERLPPRQALAEAILLGLRTSDGIDPAGLSRTHGMDFDRLHSDTAGILLQDGLLTERSGRLRLTRRGIMLADEVCRQFL